MSDTPLSRVSQIRTLASGWPVANILARGIWLWGWGGGGGGVGGGVKGVGGVIVSDDFLISPRICWRVSR